MTILKMVVEVWANYNLSNVCVRLMESVNVKRDFFLEMFCSTLWEVAQGIFAHAA